MSIQLPSHTAW